MSESEVNNLNKNEKIFFISDMHLDHENIIKYCNRPFSDAAEMNHVLVSNWNKEVRQKDTVYFLGDMSFGRGSRTIDYWLEMLNGNIVCIKGNHDKSKKVKFHQYLTVQYRNHRFLLIHNPVHAPKWRDWIIHGHIHNNDLKNYPFINGNKNTINVSVETINYRPFNLELLFKMNFENIDRMEVLDQ